MSDEGEGGWATRGTHDRSCRPRLTNPSVLQGENQTGCNAYEKAGTEPIESDKPLERRPWPAVALDLGGDDLVDPWRRIGFDPEQYGDHS